MLDLKHIVADSLVHTARQHIDDLQVKEVAWKPREFQFQLVPLIPNSAIAKTILVRSVIFHILTRVENQPFKQRLKQTQCSILTNLLS